MSLKSEEASITSRFFIIAAGSPTSATNYLPKSGDNQAVGVTSGSSHDLSDDDDLDTEAGPCEQSDQVDVKRIKRYD